MKEIQKELSDLKNELLKERGAVTVVQLFEEYLKRYPERDTETVLSSCVINK